MDSFMAVLVQHGFGQYEGGCPYDPPSRMFGYRSTRYTVRVERRLTDSKGSYPCAIDHEGALYVLQEGGERPVYVEAYVERSASIAVEQTAECYWPGTAPGEPGHNADEEVVRQRAIDRAKSALSPSRKAREAKPGRVYRVVETDNFGGDYPDESFEGPCMTYADCERVAEMFNKTTGADCGGSRFYKVVHESYKLQPGFEP